MTLFGGSWSCVECGKEYCFECESEMLDKAPVNLEVYQNDNARLYKCSKGSHSRVNLFATTIFELEELQFHWLQMIGFAERAKVQYDKKDVQQLLPNENVAQVLFPTIDVEGLQSGEEANRERAAAADRVDSKVLEAHLTPRSHNTSDPSDPNDIPVHPFYRIEASELTEALFDRMWREGIPMLIDNAGKDLSEDWSPQGFKTRFGREDCCESVTRVLTNRPDHRSVFIVVFDCQAEVAEDSTIEDFYDLFDSARDDAISKVLKLKDWPGNTEFKAHCPTLYDDFMQSLPVPDYTRRDGVTNISAFVGSFFVSYYKPKIDRALSSVPH
jgi:lysine-specific demethylase 3